MGRSNWLNSSFASEVSGLCPRHIDKTVCGNVIIGVFRIYSIYALEFKRAAEATETNKQKKHLRIWSCVRPPIERTLEDP